MTASDQPALSAIAALEEPTRRRLYDYVRAQPDPVSRDEAATAAQTPRTTAAFHLDRLVDEGLLEVVYQRRSGRTGPGAGRPAKLYRRSPRQFTVSLPDRRYELAATLLATALQEAQDTGTPPRPILDRHARQLGESLADPSAEPVEILESLGFEPQAAEGAVVLRNCPFHRLAAQHTELVCGMNLSLLAGLLEALPGHDLVARLAPAPGHCCVRLEPRA